MQHDMASSSNNNEDRSKKDEETVSIKQERQLRIVSLLPSITEILSSLGVADQIVGITHECDYPTEALEGAKVVTISDISPRSMTQDEIHQAVCGSLLNGHSLYGLNQSVLQEIKPDIIFTQSLCDVCAVSYPVVVDTCAELLVHQTEDTLDSDADKKPTSTQPIIVSLEPTNLNDVLETFLVAGRVLNLEDCALKVRTVLLDQLERIRKIVQKHLILISKPLPKVAFLEWHDPIFTGGHWIPDMMEIAGCCYTMCRSGDRSAPMPVQDFIESDPDYILIGPCGFSLSRAVQDTLHMMYQTKPWWQTLRAVQNGNVYALDGNSYYARPGPRLVQGCGIMARCVHGEGVGKELGEDLAPSSGMQRITLDMYTSTKNI